MQVLEGPLGDAIPLPADRLQLRAAALVRAGDLPAAAACYRQALAVAPDDWLSWQLYLDCVLPGSGSGEHEGGGGSRFPVGIVGSLADIWDQRQEASAAAGSEAAAAAGLDVAAAVAAAEEAAVQLAAEVAASDTWRLQCERGTLRAPHLWRCELLLRRMRLAGSRGQAPAQEDLAAAVGEAFCRLAGNFSCVADLRPYLAQLAGPAAEQLAAEAHRHAAELNAADPPAASADSSSAAASEAGGSEQDGAASGGASGGASSGSSVSGEVQRLQRLVNADAVAAEMGLPRFGSPGEAEEHAGRLLDLYRRHMHLSGELRLGGRAGEAWGGGRVSCCASSFIIQSCPHLPACCAMQQVTHDRPTNQLTPPPPCLPILPLQPAWTRRSGGTERSWWP